MLRGRALKEKNTLHCQPINSTLSQLADLRSKSPGTVVPEHSIDSRLPALPFGRRSLNPSGLFLLRSKRSSRALRAGKRYNLRGRKARQSTKDPMWGYPVFVLGAVCSFLEPFRGHLSPNIDNVSEKLTLRYPHKGPWVAPRAQGSPFGMPALLPPPTRKA
jgi:hypothetical protein